MGEERVGHRVGPPRLVSSPGAALLVLRIVPAMRRPRALRAAKIHRAIRAGSMPLHAPRTSLPRGSAEKKVWFKAQRSDVLVPMQGRSQAHLATQNGAFSYT